MHVRARDGYRPRSCLPCDLLLVKAGTPEQWIGTQMDDPLYGLRRYVSGRISTTTVPGRHTRIFATDSQPFIAETLRKHIDGSVSAAWSGATPLSARRASLAGAGVIAFDHHTATSMNLALYLGRQLGEFRTIGHDERTAKQTREIPGRRGLRVERDHAGSR